ncbi:zinc finger protein [Dactylonectria estremocensis]|uniref:Zinc finger protein n=1 Tax=Dactylonectria estremocensis TaxID=1079267 RepID=A0A9P9IS96_9HYPO|nr:zinc finger protein [Dactylonectria estremocensis]
MGVTSKRTITKTRRKTRDVDQIKADLLSPKHLSQWKDSKAVEDLPDLGRNYCTECAKWFDTEPTLVAHRKGKPHRRRVKQLSEVPYTQKEAEAAAGLGPYEVKQNRNPETGDDVDMAT